MMTARHVLSGSTFSSVFGISCRTGQGMINHELSEDAMTAVRDFNLLSWDEAGAVCDAFAQGEEP